VTDWVIVALSGGSVCLGGGLTMVGQYFADRRSQVRDREARREGFRITNYEIQRDSLHELQETMLKLDRSLSRTTIDSKFHDLLTAIADDGLPIKLPLASEWYQLQPIRSEAAETIAEFGRLWAESKQPDIPAERKRGIAVHLKAVGDKLKTIGDQFKIDPETLNERIELSNRIKILAARSGDDTVFKACGNLIQMLNKRTSAKNAEESESRTRDARKQVNLTLDAVNNALLKGPLS
jgi:hypothetical protein